jgi:hypothetical protein
MMPIMNRNPTPGTMNTLYKDLRTNIGLMRAAAGTTQPQQQQQNTAKPHAYIQQLLQRQQQTEQQQQPRSTGGVRRSNNGVTTQFRAPAPVAPIAPESPASVAAAASSLQIQSLEEKMAFFEEKISILEGLVTDQVRDLGRVRDELEISSIGNLKVRAIDSLEVFDERSVGTGEAVEVIPAGTVLKVSYPFEENEEGIWAAKQVVELTESGLMLTGRYFLLAERTGAESFSPKVLIEL